MNTYPFKSENYRQYRNTFLQDVIVGFEFKPSTVEKSVLNANFKNYIMGFFGVDCNSDITTSVCNITKKDLSLIFDFSDHNASVRLSAKDYVRFSETVLPQVFKLREFFNKVVKVEKFTQIGIRKLNVFNIKTNGTESVDHKVILQSLFSKEFIANLSDNNLSEEECTVPNLKKCIFKTDDNSITIRTALLPPSRPDDSFHHLLLDTLGELHPADGVKFESVAEELIDFNKVLYDCYHWCVNDSVKNVMQQADTNKTNKQ